MEITRRTSSNNRPNRANILRDWGPTLVKLGQAAYQLTQQQTKSGNNNTSGLGSIVVSAPPRGGGGGGNRRKRGGGGNKTQGTRGIANMDGVPRSLNPNNTMRRTVKGSIVLQYSAGTLKFSRQIGCSAVDNTGELVSPGTMHGVDLYYMRCFGNIKVVRCNVSFKPCVADTVNGYVAIAVRSNVDTTDPIPTYIRQVPGSIFTNLKQPVNTSFVPTGEHGIITRPINTEQFPSDDVQTRYAGTVMLYSQSSDTAATTVAGILDFTLDLYMWNS